MIVVPSAFTAFTGQTHEETLLRGRASEYQALVIADQFNRRCKSFETHGHSMIVDPWGQVLANLADGPGVILAEIDLDYFAKVRAELSALKQRRRF